jgi:uncharacterized protein YcnI
VNRDASRRRRSAARGAIATTLALGVLALSAAPAAAHVTVTPSTTAAGAYAVLDVSVPHGCEGSSTTEVTIQIPEPINAVTPTRHPMWEVEKQVVSLDPPVTDGHGNQLTERVASVTYRTDTPLPDAQRDAFELSLKLPDTEGQTLLFPTVQTCEQGEAAWIQVPAEGQSADELERPAPAFVLTAAEGGGHDGASDAASADSTTAATRAEVAPAKGSDSSDALALAGLGAGVVGALLGGAALVLQRRRT